MFQEDYAQKTISVAQVESFANNEDAIEAVLKSLQTQSDFEETAERKKIKEAISNKRLGSHLLKEYSQDPNKIHAVIDACAQFDVKQAFYRDAFNGWRLKTLNQISRLQGFAILNDDPVLKEKFLAMALLSYIEYQPQNGDEKKYREYIYIDKISIIEEVKLSICNGPLNTAALYYLCAYAGIENYGLCTKDEPTLEPLFNLVRAQPHPDTLRRTNHYLVTTLALIQMPPAERENALKLLNRAFDYKAGLNKAMKDKAVTENFDKYLMSMDTAISDKYKVGGLLCVVSAFLLTATAIYPLVFMLLGGSSIYTGYDAYGAYDQTTREDIENEEVNEKHENLSNYGIAWASLAGAQILTGVATLGLYWLATSSQRNNIKKAIEKLYRTETEEQNETNQLLDELVPVSLERDNKLFSFLAYSMIVCQGLNSLGSLGLNAVALAFTLIAESQFFDFSDKSWEYGCTIKVTNGLPYELFTDDKHPTDGAGNPVNSTLGGCANYYNMPHDCWDALPNGDSQKYGFRGDYQFRVSYQVSINGIYYDPYLTLTITPHNSTLNCNVAACTDDGTFLQLVSGDGGCGSNYQIVDIATSEKKSADTESEKSAVSMFGSAVKWLEGQLDGAIKALSNSSMMDSVANTVGAYSKGLLESAPVTFGKDGREMGTGAQLSRHGTFKRFLPGFNQAQLAAGPDVPRLAAP